MSRILVIGDIHGGLRALHQIMERAKVTKEDVLIFLGKLFFCFIFAEINRS